MVIALLAVLGVDLIVIVAFVLAVSAGSMATQRLSRRHPGRQR